MFDEEYEEIDSSIRNYDDNKYCLFVDSAGYNEVNSVIDVHWHEWLEIVHIIDRHMKVITPQGSFDVNKNETIVIGMQSLHKIIGNTGNFRFQCFHINNGFILQHMPTSMLNDKIFVVENNDTFSRILFYVSTRYREDISLQHLSQHFGYTTQHISLMFKRYLNTNYYTYLTKLRLDRAKFLLMTSKKHIIDIALECDFSSEHAFINHFKKWYQMTPSQYRKMNHTS